ncbi:MAG: type IX secretion system membrane protein PorP/SprF [Flavobacteriaceae bacterium]|nr:type IX secretion system membrane protein PorP/SprF [Flavobacteriaceae bacterium]
MDFCQIFKNLEHLFSFLLDGFVFDLNKSIKFSPSILVKTTSGAPLSMDFSTNFLLLSVLIWVHVIV